MKLNLKLIRDELLWELWLENEDWKFEQEMKIETSLNILEQLCI